MTAAALAAGAAGGGIPARADEGEAGRIMTVTGPITPGEMGRALIHEHVVVDFIGAARTTPQRYDQERAFHAALPHMRKLYERGVRTLVECTPRYIGRNAALLRRLSAASQVRIITNTGWYAAVDHKFLPPEAQTESAEKIAARWLAEWREGIREDLPGNEHSAEKAGASAEPVRPGFLKLGTGSGPLPPVDAKLVRAAALAHRESGLSIAIHTGDGAAALDELRLLRGEKIAPSALIWVHAMNDPGPVQIEAAKEGAWISLDGYSSALHNAPRFVKFLEAHRAAGTLNRVLLSHDDGWAVQGDAPTGGALALFENGNKAPYESIFTTLLPTLREKGFSEADIDQLLVVNPREALTIRKRLL